jgi:hypothetical protein
MKFKANKNEGYQPLLPNKQNHGKAKRKGVSGYFRSSKTNLKMEMRSELQFENFRLLRELKSITKNGYNIEFSDNLGKVVSIPEDIAISVLNKSLKKGLEKGFLTKKHIVNVMQQISNLDEHMADKLLDKAASKERSNLYKLAPKMILGFLTLPVLPATIKLANIQKTLGNAFKYPELKKTYNMALLALDKNTTATVETDRTIRLDFLTTVPAEPIMKLQSINLPTLTQEVCYRDLDTFKEICGTLQVSKYDSAIDELTREYNKFRHS